MTRTPVSPAEVGVAVGDFFYASWGYDQTNVDFFKVVALTPQGVKIQAWTSTSALNQPGAPYSNSVVPGTGPATGFWVHTPEDITYDPTAPAPIQTKRLQAGYQGRPALNWTSYASLSKWDGTPLQETAIGWGH